MFTLLDYDASMYLLHTLAPRVKRVLSGGYKLQTACVNARDLHPRSQSTLTLARSAQGHGLVRMTTTPSMPSTRFLKLKSPLSLLKRDVSWGSSKKTSKDPPPPCADSSSDTARAPDCPPAKLQECPPIDASVDNFRNARKFMDIPGPTAMYQTVPFASTRLLYYPFSQEKVEDMGGMLSKLQSRHGPIMRVKLGAQWIVFIETLTDTQNVVSAYENELGDRSSGLTTLPVPRNISPLDKLMQYSKDPALEWLDAGLKPQKMRRAVSKYLGPNSLPQIQNCQGAIATDFMQQLEKNLHYPKEIETVVHRYAIENSAQLCFSQRLGLLSDHYPSDGQRQRLVDSYREVIRCLGEILTGTRLFYTLFQDPFAKRFRDARAFVQSWERRQMRDATMSALKEKGVQTLMPAESSSLLISLMDDNTLTEEDISDILHTIMTTRSEASASALLMLLASLATNVDKQEKLASDIVQQLGPDGAVNQDTLQSLPLLAACINESLRLHFPMSSGGQVILSNNIVLSNYLIPAGMPIELNSRRTARNPVWFDHPNFFLPERWLGDKADKIPSVVFMPFGFMDHGCPGLRSFLFQEISIAVIKILQKYKIDLPEEYQNGQMQTVHTPFRTPKEPLPITFTLRNPSPCAPAPTTSKC